MPAEYFGELLFKPLDDGRLMEVVKDFGFRDHDAAEWPVPSGARVDGASIPRPLWSFIGGPFEGKYRDASVVHDYYCDTRARPWRAVHRVFYDAMLVSGTHPQLAKLMYAAVYYCGPRWTDQATHNVTLRDLLNESQSMEFRRETPFKRGVIDALDAGGTPAMQQWRKMPPFMERGQVLTLDLEALNQMIWLHDPDLEDIEDSLDFANVLEAPSLQSENDTTFRELSLSPGRTWQKLD